MESVRNYLPYAVGIARWLVFLCLKVIPALFYRPYTSRTLERDIKRHEMLMTRGWYILLRTGTLSGLVGGLIGFGLAYLIPWLIDGTQKTVRSLVIGLVPGFFVVFFFAMFIENTNIRVRKKFMRDIRASHNKSEKKSLHELNKTILAQNSCVSGISASGHPSLHRFPSDVSVYDKGSIENGPDCLADPVPFTPSDVTVVIPVYQPPPAFKNNLVSLIKNSPAKIYIVADTTCVDKIHAIVDTLNCNPELIEVLPEPTPGKRAALSMGLRAVRTRLTCFVDDDCQWCDDKFLPHLIKPFANRTIGGVAPKQIMRPSEEFPEEEGGDPIFRKANILEVMSDFRLAVRYIDLMATTAVDRGASCVSGRTMCFRTEAIEEEAFHHAFMNETLWGTKLLSGDDKFITRYIINKGYKTYHQLQKGCVLTTTFESSPKKHISQLIRWSRNTWRSDITALFMERKIWLHNPFTAFVLFDKLFSPFFLLYGFILIPIYSILRMDWLIFLGWIVWLHFSRALKLVLQFKRVPGHIVYLPIWIWYQYLMGFVRMYALFTMLKTHWGNRDVGVVENQVVRTGEFAADQVRRVEDFARQVVTRTWEVADPELGKDEQVKDQAATSELTCYDVGKISQQQQQPSQSSLSLQSSSMKSCQSISLERFNLYPSPVKSFALHRSESIELQAKQMARAKFITSEDVAALRQKEEEGTRNKAESLLMFGDVPDEDTGSVMTGVSQQELIPRSHEKNHQKPKTRYHGGVWGHPDKDGNGEEDDELWV